MKKIWLIIIIGLLFRIAIIPFTIHPDVRGHYLGAYFISNKNSLLSVYDYISNLPRTDKIVQLYNDNFLVYSPLTYIFHASFLKILSPLIPWPLFDQLEIDIGAAVKNSQMPYLLSLLKFPYLVADTLCLWFFLKLVEEKHRLKAAILWCVNLPLIHSAFMMGQFDIFIILFTTIGLLFAKNGQTGRAAISFAVAAGFKPFPLFFIPFLPGSKVKNLVLGAIAYLLIILPYLPSPGFRMYALMAQHSDKMWYAKIMVSGSQYLPIFAVLLFGLFWWNYRKPKDLPFWGWPMAVLLGFYSVTHFHPQWFSWISPFLILTLIYFKKSTLPIITLVLCYLAITLSFENSLNFGLFGIALWLPDLIRKFVEPDFLVSIVRGLLASTSYFIIKDVSSHD